MPSPCSQLNKLSYVRILCILKTWEEIPVITDLCLRVMVQALGKEMGTMVLQERARWLNLANLSDWEKDDILDMPIHAGCFSGFAD